MWWKLRDLHDKIYTTCGENWETDLHDKIFYHVVKIYKFTPHVVKIYLCIPFHPSYQGYVLKY